MLLKKADAVDNTTQDEKYFFLHRWCRKNRTGR